MEDFWVGWGKVKKSERFTKVDHGSRLGGGVEVSTDSFGGFALVKDLFYAQWACALCSRVSSLNESLSLSSGSRSFLSSGSGCRTNALTRLSCTTPHAPCRSRILHSLVLMNWVNLFLFKRKKKNGSLANLTSLKIDGGESGRESCEERVKPGVK